MTLNFKKEVLVVAEEIRVTMILQNHKDLYFIMAEDNKVALLAQINSSLIPPSQNQTKAKFAVKFLANQKYLLHYLITFFLLNNKVLALIPHIHEHIYTYLHSSIFLNYSYNKEQFYINHLYCVIHLLHEQSHNLDCYKNPLKKFSQSFVFQRFGLSLSSFASCAKAQLAPFAQVPKVVKSGHILVLQKSWQSFPFC
eukprot:TRINITY_DN6146_c0_g1_i4.p1 TRINITY_DN6146_c0_g1~~TRINITY_DN6146_c0_g1_i4.p1  ORF type:complete len:197 (-),score=1.77 TRINITY_DN6146_c0_g1_i4:28-618(-)